MKKLLLTLGTVAAVVAPITAVVACADGSNGGTVHGAKLTSVKLEADLNAVASATYSNVSDTETALKITLPIKKLTNEHISISNIAYDAASKTLTVSTKFDKTGAITKNLFEIVPTVPKKAVTK